MTKSCKELVFDSKHTEAAGRYRAARTGFENHNRNHMYNVAKIERFFESALLFTPPKRNYQGDKYCGHYVRKVKYLWRRA